MEDGQAKVQPSFESCLQLLRGESDEQRLVGLLLVTKFVKGDDLRLVREVFDAIGFRFIDRLIKTSAAARGGTGKAEQRSYLHLSLTIIASFCRVPELAKREETIKKIPLLLDTLTNRDHDAAAYDCFEALLLIATASKAGLESIHMPKALPIVARCLYNSASDTPWVPVAIKYLHCLLTRIASENSAGKYANDLALTVPPVSAQFCVNQDMTKFEALSVLYSLMVSDISMPVRGAIRNAVASAEWADNIRTGLGQILYSRIAVEQKHRALELAHVVLDIVGEVWLLGSFQFPDEQAHGPGGRFFMIMVETLRVEISVLLNEVSRCLFEAGPNSQSKERIVMSCFRLLESVVNLVTEDEEAESEMDNKQTSRLDETVKLNSVVALEQTVELVLELLEDAQKHKICRGEFLVACVRVTARYLVEVPQGALFQRCLNILKFMLTVTPGDDARSHEVMQCMIPLLTQITLTLDGCELYFASGGHEKLTGYLAWAIQNYNPVALVDICDILLNILTKGACKGGRNAREFALVLPSLLTASERRLNGSENDMVAVVSVLFLGLTSEDELKKWPEVGPCGVEKTIHQISCALERVVRAGASGQSNQDADLWDLFIKGCTSSVELGGRMYPSLYQALRASVFKLLGEWSSDHIKRAVQNLPAFLQLLASLGAAGYLQQL